ncbi:MAG: VWA domain-containing protein [Chloroflexaceae bacterium]|nr:VWA domain-containing protein [Chloroflexaceae bacterium]
MLQMQLNPAEPQLAVRSTPQVCYILVTFTWQGPTPADPRPVNWALVADASRSMRIPIIHEDEFRELVKAGGAHEVLVDGVPVWQFHAQVPPDVANRFPSALDYVTQALHSVAEHLYHADRLTLVVCAEQAHVLVPALSGAERGRLLEALAQMKQVDMGDATNLHEGLRLGLETLRSGHDAARVARLVLLTDGFTQHPEACLVLARQAAEQGIAVSTLGVGGDFQERLLTALADAGGGRAVLLHNAEEIPDAVASELAAARAVDLHSLALTVTLSSNVTIRSVTRVSPTLAALEPLPTTGRSNSQSFALGDMERGAPMQLLLEVVAPSAPTAVPGEDRRIRLARLRATSREMQHASTLDLIATYTATPATPPTMVLDAAARANAMQMLRRALAAAEAGDSAAAARLLQAVAERLTSMGEHALAQTAAHEAATLQQTGQTTRLGAKELTYRTRRLARG